MVPFRTRIGNLYSLWDEAEQKIAGHFDPQAMSITFLTFMYYYLFLIFFALRCQSNVFLLKAAIITQIVINRLNRMVGIIMIAKIISKTLMGNRPPDVDINMVPVFFHACKNAGHFDPHAASIITDCHPLFGRLRHFFFRLPLQKPLVQTDFSW